jgi:hypothetical protein
MPSAEIDFQRMSEKYFWHGPSTNSRGSKGLKPLVSVLHASTGVERVFIGNCPVGSEF